MADGGTLFLDELGEMSQSVQVKLLRVLQERAFERVGGTATIQVDVRLVAATNRDLTREVQEGRFREDLFYRLNVVPVELPPLRDRGGDVVILARHFLARLARKHGRHALGLAANAEPTLLGYEWPGNARELYNTLERAVVMCLGDEIGVEDLLITKPARAGDGQALPINLKELEKDAVQRALDRTDGNRRKAAELLGIGLRTLQYKIKEYDLP